MAYCEAWLGARKVKDENGQGKTEFRVEMATPPENDVPSGYKLVEEKPESTEKKIYSSRWLKTIESAKNELIKIDGFCKSRGYKIIIFFEIRGAY
jgi:hypothetical protein